MRNCHDAPPLRFNACRERTHRTGAAWRCTQRHGASAADRLDRSHARVTPALISRQRLLRSSSSSTVDLNTIATPSRAMTARFTASGRRSKTRARRREDTRGYAPNYPMIGDTDLNVSKLYGMLPATLEGTCDGRTAADNQTVRNVFVIGPDKKIKLIIVYPMTTGRNFDEVLRVIDSLQLTAKHRVATPVNWKQGDDVIIAGSVPDEEAKKIYPQGWKSPRPYIRIVPQPQL